MKKLLSSSALFALMSTGYAFGDVQTSEPQTTAQANAMMLERLNAEAQTGTIEVNKIELSASNDNTEDSSLWDALAEFEWTETPDEGMSPAAKPAIKVSERMYQPGLIGDDTTAPEIAEAQIYGFDFSADPNGIDMMIQLLEVSGYDEKLASGDAYTVFAPTNAAFRNVSERQLNRFVAGYDADKLETILDAHIVEGELSPDDISSDPELITTASDTRVMVRQDSLGQVRVADAFVIASDDSAGNGVFHVVDKIIVFEG